MNIVQKTKKNLLLYVKPVCIGEGAFLGVGVVIGPGVQVKSAATIDGGMYLYPNQIYEGRCRHTSTTSENAKPTIPGENLGAASEGES